ncbi:MULTISPECIES: hypothetical protein [unclassified Duganella]|uniref:hypothetical protein n=1 Tax=unclassified Duganella TaxID=2636909 RepID=UPI0011C0F13F|nr:MULTISPECIES: hypothetical protein [unclassified Duganella]
MKVEFDCFNPSTGKQLSVSVSASSLRQAQSDALRQTGCTIVLSAKVLDLTGADEESVKLMARATPR